MTIEQLIPNEYLTSKCSLAALAQRCTHVEIDTVIFVTEHWQQGCNFRLTEGLQTWTCGQLADALQHCILAHTSSFY